MATRRKKAAPPASEDRKMPIWAIGVLLAMVTLAAAIAGGVYYGY